MEVGPETFKFSSAPERGGLCDIYSEQIDEDGQQMLREAGSAWHKLSLQRILSASEKDRVKQRTAEAVKKQKLRKSILVDQNIQMNIPPAAFTEVDSKKSIPGMEHEPSPKKPKVTKSPMPSVQKQGNATALIGSHYLPSLDSSLPELMGTIVRETPGSPLVAVPGSDSKPINGGEGCVPIVRKAAFPQKQSAGSKANITRIRNLLISLLQGSPKGMTIKALEKAVTESLSVNPERKLFEKIIKPIATFHAPGKYILNPGVEKETFVEVAVVNSSGKSPERDCDGAREEEPPTVETLCQKERDLERPEGSYNKTHDSPAQHVSPPLVNSQPCVAHEFDGRSPRHGETDAMAAGSRGSDSSSSEESGSESDSSGNGSASSATESSSGTESDASSSSTDASMDEDVDIMSDGEDEKTMQQKEKAEDVRLSVNEASMLLQADFRNTEEIESGALGRCNPTPGIQAAFTITEEIDSGATGRHNSSPEIQADFRNTEEIDSGATGQCNSTPEIQADFRNTKEIASWASGGHNPTPEIQVEEIESGASGSRRNSNPEIQADFQPSSLGEDRPTSEDMKVREPDCMADNLLETVFGTEESAGAMIRSNVLLQSTPSKDREAFSETPDRNREQECNGSQERRKRYGSDQSTSPSHVDVRAGKRAKQLGILVGNVCEDTREISVSTWCVKADVHQAMDRSPSCETAENKDIDWHSQKGLSLEARKRKFEGSSLGAKDRPQRRVGRPSREGISGSQLHMRQHSSMKPDGGTTTDQRKKHGKEADKHEAIVVNSSERNGRASSQIASISSRQGDDSGFHSNVEGLLGKEDGYPSTEGVSESSMHKLIDSGEPSARLGKFVKARQCPMRKATLLGCSKEQDALKLAKTNKDNERASQPNSLELAGRTGSAEEQVEKPLKDAGFLKQGREYGRKDGLREEELNARPPNNRISFKEGRKMRAAYMDSGHSSRSGPAFSRGSFHDIKRNDLQALERGEFREPPSENKLHESRNLCLRSEEQCFEATSRATFSPDSERPLRVSSSKPPGPDFEKPLPFTGSSRDGMKASPGQGENSSLQELHSKERITQDAKRAQSYRPFKKNLGAGQSMQKLGADQVRQSHHGRPGSAIKGSTRSGGSDVQDCRDGSKETSRKNSNKLLGDSKASSLSQQNASRARSFSDNEKRRQGRTARDLQMSCKKQTPQSSEVQGGEFFTPYEKKEPDLRGTIYSLDQFRDYYKEFNEKYPIYAQLNISLENDKENFETFLKDIQEAKRRGDMAKLARIHGRVRKEYFQCRKRSKRMKRTFEVLHEELEVIKQHCEDYAKNIK